ncbi:MAG TPA: SDR family oxidoreductase [Usitatibacter sp.]|nr:SDR family oxidoreductase [Usitatibacter sp.]
MSDADLRGNVVIVTGASKGIGAELARQLAAKGARLVLAARHESELEAVAADCRAAGATAITVKADVSVERDCQAMVAGAVVAFGRVDTLVNNAGVSMWARFEDIDDVSVLERIMRVNYMGAVYCTRHALPHLRASRGRLVAVSSLAGRTGVPTRTGYAASKHAMTGFFDSLRIELGDSGVTVTLVYPGFVATGIRENATGPDGRPIMVSPVREGEVMSAEECARRIVRAIERRERDVVMTARGRMGLWLKLLAPSLVDRIARRAIERGR